MAFRVTGICPIKGTRAAGSRLTAVGKTECHPLEKWSGRVGSRGEGGRFGVSCKVDSTARRTDGFEVSDRIRVMEQHIAVLSPAVFESGEGGGVGCHLRVVSVGGEVKYVTGDGF